MKPDIFAHMKGKEAKVQIKTRFPNVYYWTDKNGKLIPLHEMATSYLFNALKLTVNRSVDFEHRFMPTSTSARMTISLHGRGLIQQMFYELGLREDISDEMLENLLELARIVRLYI